mgnify:CR=1 FL=1
MVVTRRSIEEDFYSLSSQVKRRVLGLRVGKDYFGKIYWNVHSIIKLRNIIKNEKPDVVVGMMTNAGIISLVANFFLKSKVVVSERNYPGHKKVNFIWGLLRRYLYKYASAHAVQTDGVRKWLLEYSSAKNIFLVPNPVVYPLPCHKPIIEPSTFISSEDKVVLAVGSKLYQKGYDLLLESFVCFLSHFADIKEKHRWKLVVLGLSSDEDRANGSEKVLQELAVKLDIETQLILPGRVGNLSAWYERSDIFAMTSRYEGFPNVLLEAMAHGCFVVSFDCMTGPSDIIRHEENGLLVKAEDTAAFGEALYRAVSEKELFAKCKKNAKSVIEDYSVERTSSNWLEMFDRLV